MYNLRGQCDPALKKKMENIAGSLQRLEERLSHLELSGDKTLCATSTGNVLKEDGETVSFEYGSGEMYDALQKQYKAAHKHRLDIDVYYAVFKITQIAAIEILENPNDYNGQVLVEGAAWFRAMLIEVLEYVGLVPVQSINERVSVPGLGYEMRTVGYFIKSSMFDDAMEANLLPDANRFAKFVSGRRACSKALTGKKENLSPVAH